MVDLPASPGLDEDSARSLWTFEHLRLLCEELSLLAVALDGVCTPTSCPTMVVGEDWVFLCAAHRTPQECPAVDYFIHTLDGTAALLSSAKWFPLRTSVSPQSARFYPSVARRLMRLLGHAARHHAEAFSEFERQHHSCARFLKLATAHNLLPQEQLSLLPTAEELEQICAGEGGLAARNIPELNPDLSSTMVHAP
jgi:hypothetical protein